jgi:hypothetical protein
MPTENLPGQDHIGIQTSATNAMATDQANQFAFLMTLPMQSSEPAMCLDFHRGWPEHQAVSFRAYSGTFCSAMKRSQLLQLDR